MFSGFKNDTIDPVFIEVENSCCPTNTVTLGNGKDDGLDGLLAVIGVHENCVTVLRKSLIACFAA